MRKINLSMMQDQRAFTLLELLIAMIISALVFVGVFAHFSNTASHAREHQIRMETFLEAQGILQAVSSELRMLGNGVPFDQPNFQLGEDTLSDMTVTQPILVDSAASDSITFRLNETGEISMLTANFNPGASTEVSLTSTKGLVAGDPVYISNSVVAGDDGLYAIVASVDGLNATLTSIVASPAATFAMGSSFEEVPTIVYTSDDENDMITRDTGFGPVTLGLNASISFEYLDYNGVAIVSAPPLTILDLIDSLRSIRITVTKNSSRSLKDGNTHSVTISQIVGIRNLNLYF